jgi:hypothetical protein
MQTWILSVLLWLLPLNRQYRWDATPESQADRLARFESIAADLADVVEAEAQGQTERQKKKIASFAMALAYYESGFYLAVDKGIGKHGRGDYGKSYCLMQLNVGKGKTIEGWTGEELLADRKKCFTSGIRAFRRSMAACRTLPASYQLSAYTTGKCQEERASFYRHEMAWRIFGRK